ncbi:hypothetical protein OG413_03230 [Streptomyces sp. NBC_01433]|nr:hypothetical protein [Streptomyces sp. NBC_01433]MCX4674340.1 hypothetical protein [Streptomyces sp. NBC_01433]
MAALVAFLVGGCREAGLSEAAGASAGGDPLADLTRAVGGHALTVLAR